MRINNRMFLVSIVFLVVILAQPAQVAASYMFWKSDATGYPLGSSWEEGTTTFDYNQSSGEAEVSGFSGWFGGIVAWTKWGMSFTPTESGDCYFGCAWSMTYDVYAESWWAYSKVEVYYQLYSSSGSLLEQETVIIYAAYPGQHFAGTTWMSVDQDEHFSYSLASGTTYKIYMYVSYRTVDVASLDVDFNLSSMSVSSGPIS